MKPLDYNLVKFYIKEIYRLKKVSRHLSIITVGGILAEFIARELAQDYKKNMPRILDKLQREDKINQEQRKIFDDIKKIRKQIVHLHADELHYTQILSLKKNTLNEYPSKKYHYNTKLNEEDYKSFESVFKDNLQIESREMMELLNKLIKSFYPELFQKQA